MAAALMAGTDINAGWRNIIRALNVGTSRFREQASSIRM